MLRAAALTMAVVMAGCGSTSVSLHTHSPSPAATPSASANATASASAAPTASAGATPTPTPSAGPFAVTEQEQSNGTYVVGLVSDAGVMVASATAAGRSAAYPRIGPTVSSSNDLAYYLDGDVALHSLSPSGANNVVANLPAGDGTEAVFAVSPDDGRIAVALLTYGPIPASPPPGVFHADYKGMTLYVSDLDGSNRTNLFSSSTVAEWPVGWHGSDLVIAVSLPQVPGLGRDPFPYFAFGGYHVADLTGKRVASLCPTSEGSADGMPTPDGVLCDRYDGSIHVGAYNNSESLFHSESSDDECFALEPGAQHVACLGDNALIARNGSRVTLPGAPVGFMSAGKLLVLTTANQLLLYDVATKTTAVVAQVQLQSGVTAFGSGGWLAARIPGAL